MARGHWQWIKPTTPLACHFLRMLTRRFSPVRPREALPFKAG